MNEIKKSCDTCTYAFYTTDVSSALKTRRRQHCKNPVYNSKEYTHTMLMEDWNNGCCRLWEPTSEETKGHDHEKYLLPS